MTRDIAGAKAVGLSAVWIDTGTGTVVGGDFLESAPAGGDIYILKSIIHAWEDAHSVRILKHCHCGMVPNGTLLLIERVLPAQVFPTGAAQAVVLNDLNMLVTGGGYERTEAEFRALFSAAGFRLTRNLSIQAPMGFSLIEGARS